MSKEKAATWINLFNAEYSKAVEIEIPYKHNKISNNMKIERIIKKYKRTLEKRFNQLLDDGFIEFIPTLDIAFVDVKDDDFSQELEDIQEFEENNIIIDESVPFEKEIYIQTEQSVDIYIYTDNKFNVNRFYINID